MNRMPIETINAIEIFSNEQSLQSLLDGIEQEATDFEPDTSTPTGRKEIATQARKVSSAKVVIDTAGKKLTDGWFKKKQAADKYRKTAREFCDGLRDRIRLPLTEWEAEEARAAEAAALKAKVEADHIEALEMDDLFTREADMKRREAEIAEREEAARKKAVKEQERIRQVAHKERVQREATAKAEREAKERIAAAERRRDQAEADAAQEKIDSAKREEIARQEATREAEERAERDRVIGEQLEEMERRDAEAKAAKKAHRTRVNIAVKKSFVENGIDKATAAQVVQLVSNYQISNLTIDY